MEIGLVVHPYCLLNLHFVSQSIVVVSNTDSCVCTQSENSRGCFSRDVQLLLQASKESAEKARLHLHKESRFSLAHGVSLEDDTAFVKGLRVGGCSLIANS